MDNFYERKEKAKQQKEHERIEHEEAMEQWYNVNTNVRRPGEPFEPINISTLFGAFCGILVAITLIYIVGKVFLNW